MKDRYTEIRPLKVCALAIAAAGVIIPAVCGIFIVVRILDLIRG